MIPAEVALILHTAEAKRPQGEFAGTKIARAVGILAAGNRGPPLRADTAIVTLLVIVRPVPPVLPRWLRHPIATVLLATGPRAAIIAERTGDTTTVVAGAHIRTGTDAVSILRASGTHPTRVALLTPILLQYFVTAEGRGRAAGAIILADILPWHTGHVFVGREPLHRHTQTTQSRLSWTIGSADLPMTTLTATISAAFHGRLALGTDPRITLFFRPLVAGGDNIDDAIPADGGRVTTALTTSRIAGDSPKAPRKAPTHVAGAIRR